MEVFVGARPLVSEKVILIDANGVPLRVGELIIYETQRGLQPGKIAIERIARNTKRGSISPQGRFVRRATAEDHAAIARSQKRSEHAHKVCHEKIKRLQLHMKLVRTECALDGNHIRFYFTADGRVDFRNLVRELANSLKSRIEMHQIGVRDEAQMLGGLGPCGRPFCCSSFMRGFNAVSIKMAKEQGLSLNPLKISGTCGRLMCCLKHEQKFYTDLAKKIPRVGAAVQTPEGPGVVTEQRFVAEEVRVRISQKNSVRAHNFAVKDVKTAHEDQTKE